MSTASVPLVRSRLPVLIVPGELPGATVPVEVTGPTVPEPPRVAPVLTVTAELASTPLTRSLPTETVVAPVKVLVLLRVRVSVPTLVRLPPAPWMTPAIVLLTLLSPMVRLLACRSTMAFAVLSSELRTTAPVNRMVSVPVTLGDSEYVPALTMIVPDDETAARAPLIAAKAVVPKMAG